MLKKLMFAAEEHVLGRTGLLWRTKEVFGLG
jgi:hypothetical protein